MVLPAESSTSQPTIKLINVLVIISNAKDLWDFLKIIDIESWHFNDAATKVVICLISGFFDNLIKRIDSVMREFQRVDTTAMAKINPLRMEIFNYKNNPLNLYSDLSGESENDFGLNLFQKAASIKRKIIGELEEIRKTRGNKIPEADRAKLAVALATLESDDLANITIAGENLLQALEELQLEMSSLIVKNKLEVLFEIFGGFNEFLKKNEDFYKYKLSEQELIKLVELITSYFKNTKKEYPAAIGRAIHALSSMEPGFTVLQSDCINFLDNPNLFGAKVDYIVRNFEKSTCPINKTFSDLINNIAGCKEIQEVLQELIAEEESRLLQEYNQSHPKISEADESIEVTLSSDKLEQLKKYSDVFINFYQLSTRITMPLELQFYSGIKKSIDIVYRGVTTDMSLFSYLTSIMRKLDSAVDRLKAMTLLINEFKRVNEYIKSLKTLFEETRTEWVFFQSRANLKILMKALILYFSNISQSSLNQDYGNFGKILTEINQLAVEKDVSIEKLNCNDPCEKLVQTIYQHYQQQVKQLELTQKTAVDELKGKQYK